MFMREWYRRSSRSLFGRLLIGYVIVIMLFLTFHVLSIQYLKHQYRDKLLHFHQTNLHMNSEKFENMLQSANNILLNLYFKAPIVNTRTDIAIHQGEISPINMKATARLLQETVQANPGLYLEDILIVYRQPSVVLSKEGSTSSNVVFGKRISSDYIDQAYWNEQFPLDYQTQLLPVFMNQHTSAQIGKKLNLIALIVKSKLISDLYMVALIDTNKSFAELSLPFIDQFRMIDDKNRFYNTSIINDISSGMFLERQGMLISEDSYLQYERGSFSDLFYINGIYKSTLRIEINKIYLVLIPILIVSCVISVIISIVLSFSIYHPVKQVLNSLQNVKRSRSSSSNIVEFQKIYEYLQNIALNNHKADQVISESKLMLKYYSYLNQLKAIKTNLPYVSGSEPESGSFIFVLFNLHFKKQINTDQDLDLEKAAFYIREFIHLYFWHNWDNSLTFQNERNQITAIIADLPHREQVFDLLNGLNKMFSVDSDYYTLTISVSSRYYHSAELAEAYEEATRFIALRELNGQIQIIEHGRKRSGFMVNSQQELELYGYLLSGNRSAALNWISQILLSMSNSGAIADEVHQFALQLWNKTRQALHYLKLDQTRVESFKQELEYCYTLSEYESELSNLIHQVSDLIQAKKEDQDALVVYVIDYLNKYYYEDISLERIADKLKISSGYLSTHFKEKSGINFKDYLTNVRMNKAKELLLHTNKKLQEIAESVGYPNTTPFFRMFRKYIGMTPGEFRKMNNIETE